MKFKAADEKLPITIGMIGHRDLPEEDLPALRSALGNIVRELKNDFPNSPLLCVTSLAEGADQLAFDVCKEHGMETLSVLPMPYEDFKEDFKDNSKLLSSRWQLSDHRYEVPWLDSQKNRNLQYDAAARLISNNVHYLIVFWDGQHIGLQGGTGETVENRLNPKVPKDGKLQEWLGLNTNILKSSEAATLIHIHTRRQKEPEQNITPGTIEWHVPDNMGRTKEQYAKILADHNRFNRDSKLLGKITADEFEQLMDKDEISAQGKIPSIIKQFSIVDHLAVTFRKLQTKFLWTITLLSWLALLLYEFYGNATQEQLTFYLVSYILSLLVVWVTFIFLSRFYWQDRFLDYRTIAEILRVQHFWLRYGIHLNAADHCLETQSQDLVWIRYAIRSNYLLAIADPNYREYKSDVKERWVSGQKKYFEKSRIRDTKQMKDLHRLIPYCLICAILLVILHYLYSLDGVDGVWLNAVLNASVFFPTLAVVLGFIIQFEGYEEHVNQYETMAQLYSNAEKVLNDLPQDLHDEAFIALGQKALDENSAWVNLHRTRRLQVVM